MLETVEQLIRRALEEDMPEGDITTDALFKNETSKAVFIAKEDGVLSGLELARQTFLILDPSLKFLPNTVDGAVLKKGDKIASVTGLTKSILKGERVSLNFMQRMSGIATLTKSFVDAVSGTTTKILDTRKTTPTLRLLEKQAVRDGGGCNHRMNLSDMAMIKDNHIRAVGSISEAVKLVRKSIKKGILIEVEVETMDQYLEALKTECDIIMLDNMTTELMGSCVKVPHPAKKIEASGNMSLDRVPEVAKTGVDFISVGALTHSYRSLDISLRFQ